jgi:hypothetical protein
MKINNNFLCRASVPQNILWLEWSTNRLCKGNNCPAYFKFSGLLDVDKFKKAVSVAIDKYQIFRSLFCEKNGELYQVTFEPIKDALEIIDATTLKHTELNILINSKLYPAFHLYDTPLHSLNLITVSENEFIFIAVFHHIIIDGTSAKIFFKEIENNYNKKICTENPSNQNDKVPGTSDWKIYEDKLKKDKMESSMLYWKAFLSGYSKCVKFVCNDTCDNPYNNGHFEYGIMQANIIRPVLEFCRYAGFTLFECLFVSFYVLMYKHSYQEDITITYPLNIRPYHLSGLIGYYTVLQPMRVKLSLQSPINDVFKQIREGAMDRIENLPYVYCVVNDPINFPLPYEFNVTFGKTNDISLKLCSLSTETIIPSLKNPNEITYLYDNVFNKIEFLYDVINDNVIYKMESFNNSQFTQTFLQKLLIDYQKILISIIADPKQKIGTLMHLNF